MREHINHQPKSRRDFNISGRLKVHSIFATIQGEGPFVGRPAVFVRLSGCNLQCPACDTEYTRVAVSLETREVLDRVFEASSKADLVVITGGEPFRQYLTPLVERLLAFGLTVQIETNGTYYETSFPYEDVTVVCSPKTDRITSLLVPHLAAVKYVVASDNIDDVDGLPITALDHPVKTKVWRPTSDFKGTVYVQPLDEANEERNAEHLKAAVKSCFQHGYTLCLQVHKIINVE